MSKERKALGRGFSALLQLSQDIAPQEVPSVKQIQISSIELNPWQPRNHFDQEKLEELAQSIRVKGVIQPILVRTHPKKKSTYELIAGERRLRASKLAGFTKIPAVVNEFTDQDILEVALIENIQRADLNALEESLAYRNLLEQHGYTQDELAKRVGKSRSAVANMIRLLNLPKTIQDEIAKGALSPGHGRCLLSLESEEKQNSLTQEVIEKGLSVRELEQRVQAEKIEAPAKKEKKPIKLDKEYELSRQKIENRFMTSVKIYPKEKGGKIELSYADVEEFNRLLLLLTQE